MHLIFLLSWNSLRYSSLLCYFVCSGKVHEFCPCTFNWNKCFDECRLCKHLERFFCGSVYFLSSYFDFLTLVLYVIIASSGSEFDSMIEYVKQELIQRGNTSDVGVRCRTVSTWIWVRLYFLEVSWIPDMMGLKCEFRSCMDSFIKPKFFDHMNAL